MPTKSPSGVLRIQVISDLHVELAAYAELSMEQVATGADLVILAGDVAHAPHSVAIAARMFPDVPLMICGGNHEFYTMPMTIDEGLSVMRREAFAHASMEHRDIHVLEDEEVVFDIKGVSVRFLGCTLWTDFALLGDPERDRMYVERGLNDFRLIRGRAVNPLGLFLGGGATLLKTSEWLDRHDASKAFLRSRLAVPHEGPTVVVTHHCPSLRSVAQKYRKDRLSAGFASRLDDLVEMGATLWVHGHTHTSHLWRDSKGTLVVCNPAGYAKKVHTGEVVRENGDFDPKLVVDIRRGGPEGVWRAGKETKKHKDS